MNLGKKGEILVLAIIIAVAATIGLGETILALDRIKNVTGTVHYISIEGGFWGIIGDDGKCYEPIYLPSELRRGGLKAEFSIIILKDRISIRMWGTPVEILDYGIIQ